MRCSMLVLLLSGCSDYALVALKKPSPVEAALYEALPPVDPPTADPPASEAPPTGGLTGVICDPSGEGLVVGARVWVDVDDDGDGVADRQVEAVTDGDGRFVLEDVPQGAVTVNVEKGGFVATFEAEVVDGVVQIEEETCLEPDRRIAVFEGSYDAVQDLLDDLGLVYDLIPSSGRHQQDLLTDAGALGDYDMVFLNCGMNEDWRYTRSAAVGSTVNAWVRGGGALYASDWSFQAVEAAFPQAIDFWGDDTFPEEAYGGIGGTFTGAVLDPTMRTLLGRDTASLYYDLTGWAVAVGAAPSAEVLLTGPVRVFWGDEVIHGSPLAVRFEADAGRVVFTTFHNEPQLTRDMEAVLLEMILSL